MRAVTAALALSLSVALCGCETASYVNATDEAPGMPLDAEVVEYAPPVWLDGGHGAYKVVDRETGQQWWLLEMWNETDHRQIVALPIERQAAS